MSKRAVDADAWYTEPTSLAEVLMRDHGCLHHNGQNPDRKACRACLRRVVLIREWLRDNGVPDSMLDQVPFAHCTVKP